VVAIPIARIPAALTGAATILAEAWIVRTVTPSVVAEIVRALTSRRNAVIVLRQITTTTPAIKVAAILSRAPTVRLNHARIPRRVLTQRQIAATPRQAEATTVAADIAAGAPITAAVVDIAVEVLAAAVRLRATAPAVEVPEAAEDQATAVAVLRTAITNSMC